MMLIKQQIPMRLHLDQILTHLALEVQGYLMRVGSPIRIAILFRFMEQIRNGW